MTDKSEESPAGTPAAAAVDPAKAQEMENKLAVAVTEAPLTFKMLNNIVRTEFVPGALRGKPMAALAAIKTGQELGLGPMTSMRAIDVIDGNPTPSAELLNAMIRKAGHSLLPVHVGADYCELLARRRDDPADPFRVTEEFAFVLTIEDMDKVTYKKDGKWVPLTSKKVWKDYTPQMLWARCVSWAARVMFPDVTLKLGYTADELAPADEAHPPVPGESYFDDDGAIVTIPLPEDDPAIVEADVVEDNEGMPGGDGWDELVALIGGEVDTKTRERIEAQVRRLYQLMSDQGIWPDGSLYDHLGKYGVEPSGHDNRVHWAGLKRKDPMIAFAELAFTKARHDVAEFARQEGDDTDG